MAFVTTDITFSGTPSKNSVQIREADFYLGKLDGTTKLCADPKLAAWTSQKINISLTSEKKYLYQSGSPKVDYETKKECKFKFSLYNVDETTLGLAFGMGSYERDETAGISRLVIKGGQASEEWYAEFRTETLDGRKVKFIVPTCTFTLSGDLALGGGNESQDFSTLEVEGTALLTDEYGTDLTKIIALYQIEDAD